jgi:ABC-type Zn uptake system ZnuABC Zn-binding protein ZnuA
MVFRRFIRTFSSIFVLLASPLVFTACQPVLPASTLEETQPLKVVATTTILGDVVGEIGSDAIELTVLLPPGADPHTFEPTPRDIVAISDADIVFINGFGLEEFLDRFLDTNIKRESLISVSDGIQPRQLDETDAHSHNDDDRETDDSHEEYDPHVWFDPNNVLQWTFNIERTLSALDPENAKFFAVRAQSYRQELETLDAWIEEQVAQIPPTNRILISDHESFGYFAERYGFEQGGTVIPNISTAAAPSAQELAKLIDIIRETSVKAVFVGTTISPDLSSRIAEDTGIILVMLYTGALSIPDGPAGSYIEMMRYNVNAIVSALK